ncbi:MAG TPA: DUF2207 domain-containing protein, partial [Marmoricola sp.]|nr:DUF2207 domain-containing protein [Marmoricola sp.]
MGKLIWRVFGVLIVLVIIWLPVLFSGLSSGQDASTDPAVVTNYTAHFEVDDKGALNATETLLVNFPVPKHGIFRFFDRQDPSDPKARLNPQDFSVTVDGKPTEALEQKEGGGRYLNYRIGDPDVTLTGDHTYVLKYKIKGVLSKGTTGQPTQFFYNLIPGGWRMLIMSANLTATLPTKPEVSMCAVGAGEKAGCEATVQGNTLSVTTGQLQPNTPVTVKAGLDMPTPDRVSMPWPMAWERALGSSVFPSILAALLTIAAAWGGAKMARSVKEVDPAFPLTYQPPEGIGPAQGRYLLDEKADAKGFVAALLETGAAGATTLERTQDDGWTITSTGDQAAWQRLDTGSSAAAQLLAVQSRPFHTKKKDVATGQQLQSAVKSFSSKTSTWADENGLMTKAGLGWLNIVIFIAALGGGAWIILFSPKLPSVLALAPLVLAVFAIQVIMPGAATKRTEQGRRLWSELGGFHRVLSTPSSEARFDFSGKQ